MEKVFTTEITTEGVWRMLSGYEGVQIYTALLPVWEGRRPRDLETAETEVKAAFIERNSTVMNPFIEEHSFDQACCRYVYDSEVRNSSYLCTRTPRHEGPHSAGGDSTETYIVWEEL